MGTYRRIFGYVRPYRSCLLWSVLCGILLSGTTALVALLVKPVLDQIFIDRDTAAAVPVSSGYCAPLRDARPAILRPFLSHALDWPAHHS